MWVGLTPDAAAYLDVLGIVHTDSQYKCSLFPTFTLSITVDQPFMLREEVHHYTQQIICFVFVQKHLYFASQAGGYCLRQGGQAADNAS